MSSEDSAYIPWAEKYERGECVSSGSANPSGDVTLVCQPSPTVAGLNVEVRRSNLESVNFSADVTVSNGNDYPVLVKTILIDARNSREEPISFCRLSVRRALQPGESFKERIDCSFPTLMDFDESEIDSVLVRATPWGD